MNKTLILIICIITIFLLVGCTQNKPPINPIDIAKSDLGVKSFLAEFANPVEKSNLLDSATIQTMSNQITQNCGFEIPINDSYRVTFSDSSTKQVLTVWVGKDSQKVVCSYIKTVGEETPLTCAQQNGFTCTQDQTCTGQTISTIDNSACCIGTCNDTVIQTDDNASATLTLPIDFYCYSFDAQEELNCTKTESDLQSALVEINRIWAQAGIQWTLNSFNTKRVSASDFSLTGSETTKQVSSKLISVAPPNYLGQKVWNVGIIRNFPSPVRAGGVTYGGVHVVYFAETKITPTSTIDTQYFVLAHELGHSLSLAHTDPNTDPDNLMGPGAVTAYLPTLKQEQIERARKQALNGPADPEDMQASNGTN